MKKYHLISNLNDFESAFKNKNKRQLRKFTDKLADDGNNRVAKRKRKIKISY